MSDAQERQQMLNRVNAGRTTSGQSQLTNLGAGAAGDPLTDFINQYNGAWQMQGGSAGYDMSPSIRAQYQSMRDTAATRKGESDTELTNLYSNLQKSYEGMPAQTNERYSAAIQGGQDGANQLMSDTRARIDSEAAQRASAFAELGLGNDGSLSQSSAQMERGNANVANTAANWGGLMGAQQQSQVTRDNLNYTGAADSGVLAKEDLLRRYNSYLDNVSMQEQQALSAPGVRGGGSAGQMVNTSGINSKFYDQAMQQQMIDAGILPGGDAISPAQQRAWDNEDFYNHLAATRSYPTNGATQTQSYNPSQNQSSGMPGYRAGGTN